MKKTEIDLTVPKGEAGACHFIDCMLAIERADTLFDCPPVRRSVKEMVLPSGGRADYVLFHDDGSATVVEVKDDKGDAYVLAGIAQLSEYAVDLARVLLPATIRRRLAVNCDGDPKHRQRALACHQAGVMLIPLGTNEVRQRGLDECVAGAQS